MNLPLRFLRIEQTRDIRSSMPLLISTPEVRSRRSEIRGQKSEDKRQKAEVGNQKSEDGMRRAKRRLMQIRSAKELRVYQKAYGLAMEIFEISKRWPVEERYSLTDQIRRSSRAVCANLREAWAKRRYEAHFFI